MKLRKLLSAVALGATVLTAGLPGVAQALPIVAGFTSVKLTSAPLLSGAGIGVAGLGSALISPGSNGLPVAYFPVTGGSIDTGTFLGTIAHNGSGLALTAGSTTVNLQNFLINTATSSLSGLVSVGTTVVGTVPLFDIGSSALTGFPFSLNLTAGAANALAGAFGIPGLAGLAGAQIGVANSVPVTAAVPEPSTYVMLLAGLALLGGIARRRIAVRGAVPA